MKLFLVRHADADAEVPEGLGDEARALTAKARNTVYNHFQELKGRIPGVKLILTSPLVRAVQTAQILSFALEHEGQLKAHRSLLPDMPVGTLDTLISEHTGDNIVLVGHSPSMGAMAAHLMGMQAFPKLVNPGTVIGLERDDAGAPGAVAKLLFFAAPGQPLVETLAI